MIFISKDIMIKQKLFALNTFRGKTGIVTGGSSGIGFTVVRELLNYGCDKILIASRSESRLKESCDVLNKEFGSNKCDYFVTDIRKESDVKSLFQY